MSKFAGIFHAWRVNPQLQAAKPGTLADLAHYGLYGVAHNLPYHLDIMHK
jgi:hypothetical protein